MKTNYSKAFIERYIAYPSSLQHVQEMMQERGVLVDHLSVHR